MNGLLCCRDKMKLSSNFKKKNNISFESVSSSIRQN